MSRSFGKYFDDQRDRIIKAMQNKNTQLNNEWRERYDERERKKKMGVKDNYIYEKCMDALDATFKKELDECSEKGVEISQECKSFYKNKFECRMFNPIGDNSDRWWKKNDETEENSERS